MSYADSNLNDFRDEVHKYALQKGWWDDGARNIGELIALCHSELSEGLEEARDGNPPGMTYYSYPNSLAMECPSIDHESLEPIQTCKCGGGREDHPKEVRGKPEGIPSELVDTMIRIFDMAGFFHIDLQKVYREKMEYNKQRERKHGGKAF